MKNIELINLLKTFPEDLIVSVEGFNGGITDLKPESVSVILVIENEIARQRENYGGGWGEHEQVYREEQGVVTAKRLHLSSGD
jgi:hypothetical protein